MTPIPRPTLRLIVPTGIQRTIRIQQTEVAPTTPCEAVLVVVLCCKPATIPRADIVARGAHVDVVTGTVAVEPDGLVAVAVGVVSDAFIDGGEGWDGKEADENGGQECGLHGCFAVFWKELSTSIGTSGRNL